MIAKIIIFVEIDQTVYCLVIIVLFMSAYEKPKATEYKDECKIID